MNNIFTLCKILSVEIGFWKITNRNRRSQFWDFKETFLRKCSNKKFRFLKLPNRRFGSFRNSYFFGSTKIRKLVVDVNHEITWFGRFSRKWRKSGFSGRKSGISNPDPKNVKIHGFCKPAFLKKVENLLIFGLNIEIAENTNRTKCPPHIY